MVRTTSVAVALALITGISALPTGLKQRAQANLKAEPGSTGSSAVFATPFLPDDFLAAQNATSGELEALLSERCLTSPPPPTHTPLPPHPERGGWNMADRPPSHTTSGTAGVGWADAVQRLLHF